MEIFNKNAESLDEFKRKIEEFEKETKLFRGNMQTFYRGHANYAYKCEPSIFRKNSLSSESTIFHQCMERLPYEFNHLPSTFDKLAKMQHYGAPTRLLDFTVSSEIALFFACCSMSGKEDGKIIIYKTTSTSQDDIGVQVLSALAKYSEKLDADFYDHVRMEIGTNYTDENIRACIEKSYFVIPKISNDRLHRQKGLFLIFGQQLKELYGEKQVSELNEQTGRGGEYPGYIGYIKIPANSKKAIREALKEKNNLCAEYLLPQIDEELKNIKEEC